MNWFEPDRTFGTKRPHALVTISQFYSRLFLNRYFFLFLFCLACIIVVTGKEVLGAAIFIGIICLALILCEDILATTLPFLLLCVFVTTCYDSYDTFIPYLWVAIPAALSVIFHFIVYRRKIKIGNTFLGLVAVSVALLLGGIGMISAQDYFRPSILYHTIFLGIGMIVSYLLIKSHLLVERGYNIREKFLTLLYIMGMFACFMVLFFLSENIQDIKLDKALPEWQPSNNISTILMIALPCPFFFIPRNRVHFLSALVMLSCIILTGSRAGLVLGAIEFLLCLIVASVWDKPRRFVYVCVAIATVVLGYLCGEAILKFCVNIDLTDLIRSDESRFELLERAFVLFKGNPIFGHGLGYSGNTDLYRPVEGAMNWYHMMIPQVVASMGIVGIVAYSFQLFLQARCVLLPLPKMDSEQRGLLLTLACCYGGVFLMSQLNPGLFCPLPYTLIGTLIFAVMDGEDGAWPLSSVGSKKKKAELAETQNSKTK